jgi:hypothetical protein
MTLSYGRGADADLIKKIKQTVANFAAGYANEIQTP